MSKKANTGLGGLFAIGLVFTIIGATSNAGFLAPGIVFLVIGIGGFVRGRKKSQDLDKQNME